MRKLLLLYVFISLSFVLNTTVVYANDRGDINELVATIAEVGKLSIYKMDSKALKNSLDHLLISAPEIKAVAITDIELGDVVFSYYTYNDQKIFNRVIPKPILNYRKYSQDVVFRGEKIAVVDVFIQAKTFDYSSLFLSQAELDFIALSPTIRVGIEELAPLSFYNDGAYHGISVDYLRLIMKNSQLDIEFVVAPFAELLEKIKRGDIDILAGAYYHVNRDEIGYFSEPIMAIRDFLYVKNEAKIIGDLASLKDKKVAIVDGYISGRLLEKQYPRINILKTKSLSESVNLLLNEQVDALLDAQIFVSNFQEKNGLTGIKSALVAEIPPQNVHYLIRKDLPQLSSLFNKLQRIPSPQSLKEIIAKYILSNNSLKKKPVESGHSSSLSTTVFLLVILLVALIVIAFFLNRGVKSDKAILIFGSKRFERFTLLTIVLFVAFIFVASWTILDNYRQNTRDNVNQQMSNTLLLAQDKLANLFNIYFGVLQYQLNKMNLIDEINTYVTLANVDPEAQVRARLNIQKSWNKHRNFSDVKTRNILSLSGETLLGKEEGVVHQIALDYPLYFAEAVKGKQMTFPAQSCQMLDDSKTQRFSCFIVMQPIHNKSNEVIGILQDELSVDYYLLNTVYSIPFGQSGHLFSTDWQGNYLLDKKIIEQFTSFTQESTHHYNAPYVAEMMAGGDKINISSIINEYHNDSDTRILSVTLWNSQYNYGLTIEQNEEEAFSSFLLLKRSVMLLVLIMLSFSIPSILLTLKLGRRANESLELSRKRLQKSKEDLEVQVAERTGELSRLEQQSRSILSSVGQGLIGLDENGKLLFINDSGLKMLGYQEEELLGQDVLSLIFNGNTSDNHPTDNNMNRILALSELHTSDQHLFYHKDMSTFAVEFTSRTIIENEKVKGCVIVFAQIAQRLQMQSELKQAKIVAEQASSSKSEFLANMSHEIRTPMNAVIGMSHLALQTDLNNKQRNYIQKVSNSAKSLLGIINDILDFSKIEAGKLEMEHRQFELDEMLSSLATIIGVNAEEKGLEVIFSLASNLPVSVIGDSLRLTQVLMNLCNNAVKFTNEGEIVIKVSLVSESTNAVILQFDVTDTGIGLTEKQISNLFQSFNQADASTTRRYGGTGLGLIICKKLTALMEGSIWVTSEFGHGSTFSFTAKLEYRDSHSHNLSISSEVNINKVLVVDDNATSLEIISGMLVELGIEVIEANSARQALLKLPDADIDLIITDWSMPEIDGVDFVIRAHQLYEAQYCPKFMLVTSFSWEDAQEKADAYQLNLIQSYSSKPITYSALISGIEHAFDKLAARNATPKRSDETIDPMIQQLNGAKVLLVEDNEINMELAQELLTSAGIEVIRAVNGEEAVELTLNQSLDGILMDCQMPIMDGYEATRLIKKNPLTCDIPILAMTANALVGDREKAIESGMSDHIAKPLDINDFFNKMAKWIIPFNSSLVVSATQAQSPVMPGSVESFTFVDMDSLNATSGLATCQGNEPLYFKLLNKFVKAQQNFSHDFNHSLGQQEIAKTLDMAHTLKGVAGNLGAENIARCAKNIESELKSATIADNLILALLSQIDQNVEEIANYIKPIALAPLEQNIQSSPKLIKEILLSLALLVADDDSFAIEEIEKLSHMSCDKKTQQQIALISDQISSYEFEEAGVLIADLISELNS